MKEYLEAENTELYERIIRQIDEGPIGSNKNCCAVLQAIGRVGFILPHNGDSSNPMILQGGWFSMNLYSELGWWSDEIVDDLSRFIHPDDRHWLYDPMKTPKASQVKLRLACADASYKWVLAEGVITTTKLIGSFRIIAGEIRGLGTDSGHSFSIEK